MTDRVRFEAGMAMRREVLGGDYVDRSLAAASEFSMPMQELVTEYCWGEIWNRPALSPRDRSLINLSMLTALNRDRELKAHVRGALNNGLSVAEVQEALLQTAVYCGVPAAISSFRAAEEVVAEFEASAGGETGNGVG